MLIPLGVYRSGFIGLAKVFRLWRLGGRSEGSLTVAPVSISPIRFNIIRIDLIDGVRSNLSSINGMLDDWAVK